MKLMLTGRLAKYALPSTIIALLAGKAAFGSWQADPSLNLAACRASFAQRLTVAGTDGAGGIYMAWEDCRGDSNGIRPDIYAQRILFDGSIAPGWATDGAPVCTTAVQAYFPTIVTDNEGNVLVAFFNARGPVHGGIFVQRLEGSGLAQWAVNGVLASGVGGSPDLTEPPAIVDDAGGGAFIAWPDDRLNEGFGTGVFAQHVASDGSLLWPSEAVEIWDGLTGRAGGIAVTPDGAGGAFVVWADTRGGFGASQIFAQRVASDGTPLWSSNGVQVSTSPYYQAIGSMGGHYASVADDSGGFYVGWSDNEPSDSSNVYVQHITSTGAVSPGWPAYGVRVSLDPNPTHFQASPVLTPDGAGGVVLTFRDSRFLDIRAQRVDPSGNLLWGPSGLSVTGLNGGVYHATVSDSSGGFIFGSVYSTTVYAQRVDAAGNLLWPVGGVAIGTSNSEKQYLAGVSDCAHGAIFAWSDNRNEPQNDYNKSGDIYAQNVKADGSLGGSITATLLALAGAEALPDRVVLRWLSGDRGVIRATVYRSTDGVEWLPVGVIFPDGSGTLRYDDRDVIPGHRYGYRLEGETAAGILPSEISWIQVPSALDFAFEGPWPQPAGTEVTMRVTVPSPVQAKLRVLDVAGRIVGRGFETVLDPGSHTIRWELQTPEGTPLPGGAYFVRMNLGRRILVRRLMVVK